MTFKKRANQKLSKKQKETHPNSNILSYFKVVSSKVKDGEKGNQGIYIKSKTYVPVKTSTQGQDDQMRTYIRDRRQARNLDSLPSTNHQ